MINIAICDDEQYITEQLKGVLIDYQAQIAESIDCDIFHSGESLLLTQKRYDIIFLDIYMPGIDGLEVAKRIRKEDLIVEIIYLTNYSGLTKEALSVHAFEYLEKPVKKNEIFYQLDEVIARIIHRRLSQESNHHIIEFEGGKTKIKLPVDDIYYFERKDRKVKVVTKKGDFTLYESLASIEEKLKKYDFVLSHQSFIVNICNMKDYVKDEITMMNNDIIPLAQKRSAEFKLATRKFLQKKLEMDF
jgi:DNA-binding LytR/AlgR family response regulator